MVTMKIKQFFFEPDKVLRKAKNAKKAILSRAGARLRQWARRSIRPRKPGVYSRPGSPPYSHVESQHRALNRKRKKAGAAPVSLGFQGIRHILYGYDPSRDTVIVGPISNGRTSKPATRTLEFGGTVNVMVRKRSSRGRRSERVRRSAKIAPRPYMRPAMHAIAPSLPKMWQGAIRG